MHAVHHNNGVEKSLPPHKTFISLKNSSCARKLYHIKFCSLTTAARSQWVRALTICLLMFPLCQLHKDLDGGMMQQSCNGSVIG